MRSIEDKLEKLDNYFVGKKDSEKWLIFAAVIGVVGYIGYSYFLPYTEAKYKKSVSEKRMIEKSIAEKETYIKSISKDGDPTYFIKSLDKKIANNKRRTVVVTNQITELDNGVKRLKPLLFNNISWSNFLDSITKKSSDNNLNLLSIENKFVDTNGSFGHVMEVNVQVNGDYGNILGFMSSMETNVLVTDIYSANLKGTNETVTGDINISVWGINQ